MSRSHVVISGDTLGKISTRYYGTFANWQHIVTSNPQLIGRKTASDGSPLIFPGDVLLIPDISTGSVPSSVASSIPVKLDEGSPEDISVYIDGKLYTGFTGYTVSLPLDGLDAFSFSSPWQDDIKALHKVFKPFMYKTCAVYYDKKLLFNGRLLTSAPVVNPDSKTITIQGYPLCGVLNDCCLPSSKFPASYGDMTLDQIARDVCEPFGIKVSFSESTGDKFDSVEYEPGTTVLSFLQKLAEQRGFIYTNTSQGGLQFFKPKIESVGATYKEGALPYISCSPKFQSQSMFSHLTGFTKTESDLDSSSYTYENKYLIKNGVFRPTNFVVQDCDSGGLEKAVKAKAGQMFASSVSYSLTVVGQKDTSGNVYHKGMSVSVLSPGAMIYRETKFLVNELELKRSDTEGDQTTMSLILPESYTGQLPDVLPWED